MGIGSAFASGYNAGSTRKQQRSFMPAINSLSNIISNRSRYRGRGGYDRRPPGPTSEERSDAFFNRDKEAEKEAYARQQLEENQRREDEKQARSQSLLEAQDARRQEAHEADMAAKEQATAQQEQTFERATDAADRKKAYDLVKQGLMMRDEETINAAMQSLVPPGEDVVTEGEPVDMEPGPGGVTDPARSFQGRPTQPEAPKFIFDPDSEVVGVIFPGQQKPTVFKNVEEAFKNVVAPINPAHEKTKDQIAENKATGQINMDRAKLDAKVYAEAHEAGRAHAMEDGYFQSDLFDPEIYERVKTDYIAGAAGKEYPSAIKARKEAAEQAKQAAKEAAKQKQAAEDARKEAEAKKKRLEEVPKDAYRGDKPPPGFPEAVKGKGKYASHWFIKEGDKWVPILDEEAEEDEDRTIQDSGPSFKPRGVVKKRVVRKKIAAQPTVVRKKMPPRPQS